MDGSTVRATHMRHCFWWSQELLSSPLFFLFSLLSLVFVAFNSFFFLLMVSSAFIFSKSQNPFGLRCSSFCFFFFFVLHHRTHLVFTAGGDSGDRCRSDCRYISSSFVQVRSSLHQFWVCVGLIIVIGIGGWRKKKKKKTKKERKKKKRNAWCRRWWWWRLSQGKRKVRKC